MVNLLKEDVDNRKSFYMTYNSLQLCTIQLVGNESKLIGLFIVH